jgi:hypothetical protein
MATSGIRRSCDSRRTHNVNIGGHRKLEVISRNLRIRDDIV